MTINYFYIRNLKFLLDFLRVSVPICTISLKDFERFLARKGG